MGSFVGANVPYCQCTLLSMYPIVNVPYCQCTLLSMYPIVNVPYCQCTLLSAYEYVIGTVCCNILNCINFHLNNVYCIKSSTLKFVTVFLAYYFLSNLKKPSTEFDGL